MTIIDPWIIVFKLNKFYPKYIILDDLLKTNSKSILF
jgi:hypothetical protein